jgi:hypothetical protein
MCIYGKMRECEKNRSTSAGDGTLTEPSIDLDIGNQSPNLSNKHKPAGLSLPTSTKQNCVN